MRLLLEKYTHPSVAIPHGHCKTCGVNIILCNYTICQSYNL